MNNYDMNTQTSIEISANLHYPQISHDETS